MAVEQKTRVKRAFTTKRKKLEQDLEHVTQEMYRKNLELVETNRTLSLLRAIDTLVLESQDPLKVLGTQITKAVVETASYPLVALFGKTHGLSMLKIVGLSTTVELPPALSSGLSNLYIDTDNKWVASEELSEILHVDDLTDKDLAHRLNCAPAVIAAVKEAKIVKSIYLQKLIVRKSLVAVIAVGFADKLSKLRPEDQALLERLGQAVGVAVDSKLLFEENERVAGQLKKTNSKLRALDEAKDEFISMASHQLRTPLTSVKGYVSMVMEGDAGKIPKQQRDLLAQAFASSQRMVYLIADLLNVSRLQTGKFVIENKSTQLADVVETELSQLQEAAKTKKQTLTYTKPKNFPELMLDETKIRQVIMNFTDNSLYYTPTGGHIDVKLEDKGKTIEFTVTDDGIGVPKDEQHRLFTKFYRANNARKARPDGTGLGIFMAKKVIVAQGGALIFKSQENKGSTFGFSFSKSKLKVPANAKKAEASDALAL